MIKVKAKGSKGYLYSDLEGGFFFRIYDKKDKNQFVDYKIQMDDIEILIIDDFAELAQIDEESGFLQYTDEVVGRSP
jgi:hypothetical protein